MNEKLELILADAKIFSLDPRTLHIIAYDTNCTSHKQMRELVDYLMASGKIAYAPALVGYDGNITDSPLKIYEVRQPHASGAMSSCTTCGGTGISPDRDENE